MNSSLPQGILLVNKPPGKTSFSLVAALRRLLHVEKIGHAGTLDPFATGVMVMLIGRTFTRLSQQLLCAEKHYRARVHLGIATDTLDCKGAVVAESALVPTLEQVHAAIAYFQGEVEQIPPMYSAKKVKGQKLCDLARKGKTIAREPIKVHISISQIRYQYPYIDFEVFCSKGTYIRTLASDIGEKLGCGAHLSTLERTRSGTFFLEECIDGALLFQANADVNYIKENIHAHFLLPRRES